MIIFLERFSFAEPFEGYVAFLPQSLQRISLAVIFCHHVQAGRAAIHGIKLLIILKNRQSIIILI